MRRIHVLITIAVLVAPLAGCLADDDGPQPGDGAGDGGFDGGNETGNETGGGPGGGAPPGGEPGNETGNETGGNVSGPGGNATTTYDNRTGTVSGIAIPVIMMPSAEETFDVADATLELALDIGVTGEDLDVEVRAPDCEDSSCATTGTAAEDGNFTFTGQAPTPGTWTVVMTSAALIGPSSSDYDLSIAITTDGSTTGAPPTGGNYTLLSR